MDKRFLHHIWTRIRAIKTIYLASAFVLSAVICLSALRSNNLTMSRLRSEVYTADKNGGNVEAALQTLRTYVGAHMNTALTSGSNSVYPPIQLRYTYQRLLQTAQAQSEAQNGHVYTQAEYYCQQLNPVSFSGRTRVPCVENYVATHGVHLPSIPAALYEFDFVSPKWSPDLAGWSLLVTALLLLATVLRYGLGYWARHWL
ncbi:MAG TPA: hypothetical protein VGS08_02195 [Candidatus Saccharimonadales bacterium]|nr:hypothetical protein [Candidatus Saccharimonadales bacterium]